MFKILYLNSFDEFKRFLQFVFNIKKSYKIAILISILR